MSNKKIVLAYSGGLDTTFCAVYLKEKLGYDVYAALVNCGGFGDSEIANIRERAFLLGVKDFVCLDAADEYYNRIIKYMVFGNVLKNNTYPLSVSSERIIQSLALIRYAKETGINTIAHGSTAAGNDQIRFDLAINILAPGMEIITPIRELQLSRSAETEFLKEHGVEIEFEKTTYSINKGLWGTSVGGKETLVSKGYLPEEAFPSKIENTGHETVSIQFKKGELVSVNDVDFNNPVDAIRELESIAALYGIGRDIHVGDTIIGVKGRVGFESAAPILIIKAHHLLEKHTLTKAQLFWKDTLANLYGNNLHDGLYLDPVMRDIEKFMESSQEYVSGKVYIELYPKRFELIGIESQNDLMSAKFATYGESNNSATKEDIAGFTKIYGNQTRIFYEVNQIGIDND